MITEYQNLSHLSLSLSLIERIEENFRTLFFDRVFLIITKGRYKLDNKY